jgi:hypothetical protein
MATKTTTASDEERAGPGHGEKAPSSAASEIGQMYFQWTLDAAIQLSYAISRDFILRPQLYQDVENPEPLVEFRSCYGCSSSYPSADQRREMNSPIFGASDAQKLDNMAPAPFQAARKKLLEAVIAYAERNVDTASQMLIERVRSATIPLRSNLQSIYGSSLRASHRQINSLFEQSIKILRNPHIAKVFGVDPPPSGWPENDDANGAKLVGAVGSGLASAKAPGVDASLTPDKFILLSRVAAEGRRALMSVYDMDPSITSLNGVISSVYTWGVALRDYQS